MSRILYLSTAFSALLMGLLGIVLLALAPRITVAPILSTLGVLAFAIGAYGRAEVLQAAKCGRQLPVWKRVSLHSFGLSLVLLLSSMVVFPN